MQYIQYLLFAFSCLALKVVAQSSCSEKVVLFSNSTCVWTNESTACGSLGDFLSSRRDVAERDCVEFAFNAGIYRLLTNNIDINYSAVLKAVSGIVNISCSNTTEQPLIAPEKFSYTLGFSGFRTNVTIDGIHFDRCSGPLRFTDLDYVAIHNSNFSNFVAQPTDILNCRSVEVINCRFYNCNASTPNDQYRGNAGGLSVGYHTNDSSALAGNPTVTIRNCRFYKNRALFPTLQLTNNDINFALNNRYYFGRGAGIGLYLDDDHYNITATVTNCTFDSNSAVAFGGGFYLNLNGKDTQHSILIEGCTFRNNYSGRFGAGLLVTFLIANGDSGPSQVTVNNCSFINNQAQYGGGISTNQFYNLGQGNQVNVLNSYFNGNQATVTGSSIVFTSFEYTQNRNSILPYVIQNCDFLNNTSPVGVVAAVFQHFIVKGYINVLNNFGPGLRIIGALIHVNGSITLANNNANGHVGGALYISSFGQLKLYQGSAMKFINNSGMIGAAIIVDVQKSSKPFSQLVNNPQCFLTFDDSTSAPKDYKGASVTITGNTASVGPAIYISHLDFCSWFGSNNSVPLYDVTLFPKWAVFDIRNNTSTSQQNNISSQFYVQTEAERIESFNNSGPFKLNAGTPASWSLIGRDQFQNPTYFIARLSDSRDVYTQPFSQASLPANVTNEGLLAFEPALVPILPSSNIYNTTFAVFNITPDTYRFEDTIPIQLNAPYNILNIQKMDTYNFSMTVEPCYPGYELKQQQGNSYRCSCVENNPDIRCDPASRNLYVKNGQWAGAGSATQAYVATYACPASYCRCRIGQSNSCTGVFSQIDTEDSEQCHPSRKGVLCGECINGTAVGILRRNCRQCTHEAFYALPLIVIWDIAVTIFVILASLKINVTFGPSLRPLLFYIQTAYYATEFFPASFWDARQYMLYASSGLSLYFPWDFCLYPRATSLQMSAVQFITPVTVLIVAVVALLVIKKNKVRKTWHGIIALIFLLYPSLVHNCMSLLHCPTLPDRTTKQSSMRWFTDGTVECFDGWSHTLLAVIAVLVLILLAAWIPLLFILTNLKRIHVLNQPDQERYEFGALEAGYKQKYEWWISIEFLRPFVLIAFLVFYPGKTVIPIYILIFSTASHAIAMPYKRWWQNWIEAAVMAHYIALLLMGSTQSIVTYFSEFPGTSIPDNRGTQLAQPDRLTAFFSGIFYFPLVAALLLGIAWVIYRGIVYKKKKMSANEAFDELDGLSARFSQNISHSKVHYKPYDEAVSV